MNCIVLWDILAAVSIISFQIDATCGIPKNLLMTLVKVQGGGTLHAWKLSANLFSVKNDKLILLLFMLSCFFLVPTSPPNKSQRTQT